MACAIVYQIANHYFTKDLVFGWIASPVSDFTEFLQLDSVNDKFLDYVLDKCHSVLHAELIMAIEAVEKSRTVSSTIADGAKKQKTTTEKQKEPDTFGSPDGRTKDELTLLRLMLNSLDGTIDLGNCIITREKGYLFQLRESSSNKQFVFGTAEEVVRHILRRFW